MRLAVVGTGYVGLVTGAGFADFGNTVVCVDIDHHRIESLQQGECPIHEPGLPELIRHNASSGRLRFTADMSEAVSGAEIVFLAVGTPSTPDGSADMSQVFAAAKNVARLLDGPAIVVTKSTVPVGTADQIQEIVSAIARHPVAVASNPEFLKEGNAVEDFMGPDRVIIGTADKEAESALRRLYAPIVRTNDRLLAMDPRSAELTKYAANAYLATRISFINDIANLCERTGADVELVRRGMGMDTRIGPKFLFPGIGYGGSCFPKDVRALLHMARGHGMELPMVAAAHAINERQASQFYDTVVRHLGDATKEPTQTRKFLPLCGRTIAVWGLAFKPETDDVRDAPALALIAQLLAAGARIRATDPVAITNAVCALTSMGMHNGGALFCGCPYEAAQEADALVLCTEWRQYRQPDWQRLRSLMKGDGIFDGRNIWDPGQVREAGFRYHGIGRIASAKRMA